MLSLQQLYEVANELSLKWWNVPYDGVIEVRNRRWKNTNGQLLAPGGLERTLCIPPIIQMCSKRNSNRTDEEIRGTLLHELVHWRLWSLGTQHYDTSRAFVKEAIRVGAPISGSKSARKAYERYK